jgi:Hsp70 protein
MLGGMPGFTVGVDYGSVNTVAMLRWPDGAVRPLLFDGSPLLPSSCFVDADGGIVVGKEAERRSRLDPLGQVPTPKCVQDDEVAVRGRLVPVGTLIGAAFARVGQEAIRTAAGAVPRLVLAYPAAWGEERQRLLTDAAASAGLGVPTLVPAPVATAWRARGGAGLIPGRFLLVYNVGAAIAEVALLRSGETGLEIVAARCLDDAGGLELDRTLVDVLGSELMREAADEWWRLTVPATNAERRHRLDLWQQVREAKEALSREAAVGLHIPLADRDVWLTREQFEHAARPVLTRVVATTAAVLAEAAVSTGDVAEVLLAGGTSQVPLLADLIEQELNLRPTPSDQPELHIADGMVAVAGSMAAENQPGEPTTANLPAAAPAAALVAGEQQVDAEPEHARPQPERIERRHSRRGRAGRVAALVAALVLLVVLGAKAASGPHDGKATPARPAELSPSPAVTVDDGLTGVLRSPSPSLSPNRTATSRTPAAVVPSEPPVSTGPPPVVTVSITATPAAGTCATDFTFTAHFTVLAPDRYRWHWVFGAPDGSTSTSGDHDVDKSGDVRTTKKFNGVSGLYWTQIQITSPISLSSAPAPVDVTCKP